MIKGKVPLERALSKLGLASRTQAKKLIESGRVSINNRTLTDPSFLVCPETARIKIDGKAADIPRRIILAFNKPRGYVCTRSDELGRDTIHSLLPQKYLGLHSVGRLDMATSGLLLLTNDTRLSSWLTDPSNRIPRVYIVTVEGKFDEEIISKMREGVEDKGELLKADDLILRKASNRESHLTITLTEGKNREVRRLCLYFGHEVRRLKRISFGECSLDDLETGKFKEISDSEFLKMFPSAPLLFTTPFASLRQP